MMTRASSEPRNAWPITASSSGALSSLSLGWGGLFSGGSLAIKSRKACGRGGRRCHRGQSWRADALQRIDDRGLGRVVRRGMVAAGNGDGPVAGVVVRTVALVQPAVFLGQLGVAELRVDQAQVVVGGDILGIQGECFIELLDRLGEEAPPRALVSAFDLGALEQRLAEFVDDDVVLAEIEAAPVQFRVSVLEDAAELSDGLVEVTVLFVDQSVRSEERRVGQEGRS